MKKLGEVWDMTPEPNGCGGIVLGIVGVVVLLLGAGFFMSVVIPFVVAVLKAVVPLGAVCGLAYLFFRWLDELEKG